jgi:hypothetical protein
VNRPPFVAGRLEVEQQIGAPVLQMLEEKLAAGAVGVRFRPRVPFLDDGHLCGVIVSDRGSGFVVVFSGSGVEGCPDA